MKVNCRRFSDKYRGDGYMISFRFNNGWILFALRPKKLHLYFTKPYSKPAFRFYCGPFEIEFFRSKS